MEGSIHLHSDSKFCSLALPHSLYAVFQSHLEQFLFCIDPCHGFNWPGEGSIISLFPQAGAGKRLPNLSETVLARPRAKNGFHIFFKGL